MDPKKVIICRCEDITLADVREYLEKGFVTFEDLKRQLRVGMGPCQGATCSELIQREIARFLGKKVEDITTQKSRPLTAGVKLRAIAEASQDET